MKFIDEARIFISAGNGGPGCVSFRREKFVPLGGPDGGNGGAGGHVILQATRNKHTLIDQRYKQQYKAPNGRPGEGNNRSGKAGDNLVIPVPQGTLVFSDEGELLADLVADGQEFVAARGGKGGKGNACFATAVRQAPEYAQPGIGGESRWIRLELKLLADVGIIGLPNAGKSTLISRISAAKPRIADYPFTTLTPQLGVVSHQNRSFVVADLPGLVEGAHEGIGLGHRFLRHVSRTSVFIHMVSVEAGADTLQNISIIENELRSYDAELARRPVIIGLSKTDLLAGDREALESMVKTVSVAGYRVVALSAVSGDGIKPLLDIVVGHLRPEQPEPLYEESEDSEDWSP